MTGWLGDAYLWVKAAHVVFMVFWVAGLFMLPRYLVHHQEGLGDPAEGPRWVKREALLRRMILTPAMGAVWLLGLALAAHIGLFDGQTGLGWLHAKLLLVVALSGYHGWAVGYSRKLAAGRPTLAPKTLRLLNEVPALAVALIVVLAVVKPF
ncbi:CopD family protein [Sphingomonas sp.]|jgi:putative membrane protein|uniref:CopD family protein n=1 Tax=Sphingomonas sp. TaxID=28214 RepID=UPI002D7F9427|nr:CopD family protein [Sphingomonas sp.]HEU0045511.1 CopD family protein [Sphingomonas sp.]